MKKNILIIALLVFALALMGSVSGCAISKKAVDAGDFEDAMDDLDLTTEDYTEFMADEEGVTTAIYASDEDSNYMYMFLEIDSKSNTGDFFDAYSDEDEILSGDSSDVKGEASGNGTNYAYVEITTKDGYYYICRVDDTVIMAQGDVDYKDDIKKGIKAIGY